MAEGQTHVHRINFKPNKILDREVEELSNTNIKGLALYQMLVIHGTPSDPNSNAVTTCGGKIDYVFCIKTVHRFKNGHQIQQLTTSNNLPVTAGQHTMDLGSGTDHAVIQS